ncbi:SubName: Full=Uncharacterized protein {ECO:0000313/EMBL:CCA75642.1} [Serendipita indica DSM 11827]|nr:SubName: Full=Uncharacterized protein {ECO:0000313/EMBL:CCA75642.1} [Serendipita indica DSM 11827]
MSAFDPQATMLPTSASNVLGPAGPNAYFEPYNGATSVSNQMFQAGDHQAVHAQAHGVGGFPTWSPPLYSTQSYIPLEGPLLTMASGQQNNTVPSSSLDPATRTSLPAPQHQHDPTAFNTVKYPNSLIRIASCGQHGSTTSTGQASTTSTSSEAVPNALNTSPESSTVAQYLADLQRSADSLIPVRPDVTRNKNKFAPNKRNPEKFWTNFFSSDNSRKIAHVVTRPEVKQAAKDLIMHRLATKTCFDLDKDQALVWEEFVDFFNQCEQNFELIPLNARKELVAASFTSIIGDAYAAFKFPALSVVVIPGDPNNAPEARIFNIAPPENKLSPLAWLAHERPNVAAGFRAGMQAYAHYFFDSIAPDHSTTLALPTAQAETTSESTADQSDNQNKNKRRLKSPDIYKVPLLGERDGIRLWALDDNVSMHDGRSVLSAAIRDRYLRAGHDESKWGWKYIMANMDNLCYPDVIPVVTAENKPTTRATLPGDVNWNKDHLNAWIGLIQSHQKGTISWARGMLFKPTPKAKAIAAFSPELLPSEDSRTVTNARLVLTNSPDENDSVPAFGGTQNVNIGQLGPIMLNALTGTTPATTPAAANVMVDKPRTEVPYEQLTPAQKRKRTRALNLAKQAAQTEATNPRVAKSSLNIEAAQNDGIGKRKVACLEMFEIAQFGHR